MIIKDGFIGELHKRVNLKNKKVLEIGCGDGRRTHQIGKFFSTKIIAIDPDKRAIVFAKKNYNRPNVRYAIGKAERLSFPDNYFDCVIFTLSLHHTKFPNVALREAQRVLKKRGLIIVIEPGFKGTIFEVEKIFNCFEGDETKQKKKTLHAILKQKGVKLEKDFLSRTDWEYDNENDFKKDLRPKKNLPKIKSYLERHNYKLWGERRIIILQKT